MAELVVALDFGTEAEALEMAGKIKGIVPWAKVGLELFVGSGPGIVGRLKDMGFRVFLDLKFHDIPNTVKGAVREGVRLGADMLNVHASGGDRMLQAAAEGRDEAMTGSEKPLLLAVTALTSLSPEEAMGLYGRSADSLVLDLAKKTGANGLDGIVCSAQEVSQVKAAVSPGFVCLTPGIRMAGVADDQRRVMTPEKAVKAGSDYLVVGRPITRAESPEEAARRFLAQMNQS